MKYLLLLIAFLSSCTTTIPVVEESINCPSQLIEKTPLKATDLPCTDYQNQNLQLVYCMLGCFQIINGKIQILQ